MEPLEILSHIDTQLITLINYFGPWMYVVLYMIIFAETGLIITPLLPGNSLLFAVGALAGGGYLHIGVAYVTVVTAAIVGNTVNYWVGYRSGQKVFSRENSLIFNKAYLKKTREFYEKHGGKTIILARFLTIIRTFAPFVAGVGRMQYGTFLFYTITGAFIWVTSVTLVGYYFGALPFVKEYFGRVVALIVLAILIPTLFEYTKRRGESRTEE